jgi:hypothetical protein
MMMLFIVLFQKQTPYEIGCREGGSETHLNMLYNVDVDDLFHRDLYQLLLEDYSLYRNLHRE